MALTGFILRRTFQACAVIAAVAVMVFAGIYAVGNPADVLLAPDADQRTRDAVIENLGLDKPLWRQFLIFLGNLAQGDFGRSFVYGTDAVDLIVRHMPATIELAMVAMLIALLAGIPLGVIAGVKHDRAIGKAIMSGSIVGTSLPNFWFGLMLILIFAVNLQWLPSGGRGPTATLFGIETSLLHPSGWKNIILPAVTLSLFNLSLIIRVTASGTREVLAQDYVKFARAKGLSPGRVLVVHCLKNTLIPVVTLAGLEFGNLIAGAVVTESIFGWPGMGKLLVDSINRLDRPVVVAYIMIVALIFVLINMLVDILYTIIDPRISISDQSHQN